MLIGITGGPGFLGGYICSALREAGHELRVLVRSTSDASHLEHIGAGIQVGDVEDPKSQEQLVEGCGCVVHAAVDFEVCRTDQFANFKLNLLSSLRLMELCRWNDAQFIFISTGAVHEKILDDRPLDEAHPLWPASTYGAYKAAVEAFLCAYKPRFDFNGCAVRPTSIYGVHLTKPERSHWYGLVEKVVRGERIETGSGGKIVHVEDVAEVVKCAVGCEDVAGEVYELTDCHIYDHVVAEFARDASGSDAEIADVKGSGPKHQIISDKARQTFGVGLDRGHEGVREYVKQLVEVVKRRS